MNLRPLLTTVAVSCLLSRGALCADVPATSPAVEEIVVVFKTHFDIGYTDLAKNVVERYRTSMIDKALDLCEQSRELSPDQRFVWTVPGWPMTQMLWPEQDAARRERILQAVRDGRLVWHALPFTMQTEALDPESVVRGLQFSSELSKSLGMPLPRDAKMTDVPSHSWLVPTVLKRAGIDFLHIGCNSACSSPEVPRLFWWEGPDGSRLLTMYDPQYGSGLIPPRDWSCKTWLAMMCSGDNHGPPAPGEVEKLLRQARQELPGVKVHLGRLSDFADAVLKENPKLPVIRGDMPDTWIQGIMAMPVETAAARQARASLASTESLNTLLRVWGVRARPADRLLAQAYEQALLFGEHTWGLSGHSVGFRYGDDWRKEHTAGKYARIEQSWDEHAAYARTAAERARVLLQSQGPMLAKAVAVSGPRVTVFNPLPWKRSDVVGLKLPPQWTAVRDAETDRVTALEFVGDGQCFVATDVPPLGYRTYQLLTDTLPAEGLVADASQGTIENAFLRVSVDGATGTITSIRDKRSGREIVDGTAEHGCAQYLHERFGKSDVDAFLSAYLKARPQWALDDLGKQGLPPEPVHVAMSPRNFAVQIKANRVAATATMQSPPSVPPHQVRTTVTLYKDLPYLDLELSVIGKPADPWPEAGWICLPLNVASPAFRLARPGFTIDPGKDVIRGSNTDLYCVGNGLTVTDSERAGVGICPLDSPLVSLDRPGLWRYSRDFVPRRPRVYVNVFNNMWSTNYPLYVGGTWSSRVRLWLVDAAADASLLTIRGEEARRPLIAGVSDGNPGPLPPSKAGIEFSRGGIVVTAFGRDPDGRGLLLRLWEQAGQHGPCQVTLPERLRSMIVQPCDLRGRLIGSPLGVHNDTVSVDMPAYAPVTLLIETPE